MKPRVWGKR